MSDLLDGIADQLDQATLPDTVCTDIQDEATIKKCWAAYQAYFEYYLDGFEHRRRVFDWQYISTLIIFVVVILLVAIGIFFAWIQFRLSMSADNSNRDTAGDIHEVEISTSGVRVSSPVLGVIILTLSLAFFYLYLVHIFPIAELL